MGFKWDNAEEESAIKIRGGGSSGERDLLACPGPEDLLQSILPVNLVQIEDLIIGYFLLERLQHNVLLTFTRSNEGILIYYNLRLCLMFWWWWEECLEGADYWEEAGMSIQAGH